MSLDTNKPVESITYNGVAFPLASTGGATTASAVSYTNTNLEGVTNAQGALDAQAPCDYVRLARWLRWTP